MGFELFNVLVNVYRFLGNNSKSIIGVLSRLHILRRKRLGESLSKEDVVGGLKLVEGSLVVVFESQSLVGLFDLVVELVAEVFVDRKLEGCDEVIEDGLVIFFKNRFDHFTLPEVIFNAGSLFISLELMLKLGIGGSSSVTLI